MSGKYEERGENHTIRENETNDSCGCGLQEERDNL